MFVTNPYTALQCAQLKFVQSELHEKIKVPVKNLKSTSRKVAQAEYDYLKTFFGTRGFSVVVYSESNRGDNKVKKHTWSATDLALPELPLPVQRPEDTEVITIKWKVPEVEVVALTEKGVLRVGEQVIDDLEQDGDYLIGLVYNYNRDRSDPYIRLLKSDYERLKS